jgi:hypothetical protein
MSDEPGTRGPIVTLTGPSVEEDGDACLLAYWLGSQIEIVVTEKDGASGTVLLSEEQARDLARSLAAALDKPST